MIYSGHDEYFNTSQNNSPTCSLLYNPPTDLGLVLISVVVIAGQYLVHDDLFSARIGLVVLTGW
jgi:hypothetical protein